MSKLIWDAVGAKRYEKGNDRGVLYPTVEGVYGKGVSWDGLISVSESPSGGESNPQYADNIKYADITGKEEFGASIEAFSYPLEFAKCDGTAEPIPGVFIGQQGRTSFGMAYTTGVGNDIDEDLGYKIHLLYGCKAAPSEKGYTTDTNSPEAITFSWEITTTPVKVPGYKPSATFVIDSTIHTPEKMKLIEDILYGSDPVTIGEETTEGTDPRLPLPAEIIELMKTV